MTSMIATILLSTAAVFRPQTTPQVVQNAAPRTTEILSLSTAAPILRLDGSEGGRDPFFRIPSNAGIVAYEGGFAVASAGTQELRFYSARASLDTVVGGAGDGPGEFRLLSWIHLKSPDSIVTYDGRRRVVAVWTTTGKLSRELPVVLPTDPPTGRSLGFVPPIAQGVTSDGSIVYEGGVNLTPGNGILRARAGIMRLQPSSSRADTITSAWIVDYHEVELPTSPMIAFPRHISLAISGDRVSLSEGGEYRIETFGLDGRHLRSTRVERPARPVAAEDREAYRSTRPQSNAPIPERFPAYETLWHDLAGRLWAELFTAPTDTTTKWDVFDADGKLIGTLEVPTAIKLQASDGTRVFGVHTDDDGVQYVEVYELPTVLRNDTAAPSRQT